MERKAKKGRKTHGGAEECGGLCWKRLLSSGSGSERRINRSEKGEIITLNWDDLFEQAEASRFGGGSRDGRGLAGRGPRGRFESSAVDPTAVDRLAPGVGCRSDGRRRAVDKESGETGDAATSGNIAVTREVAGVRHFMHDAHAERACAVIVAMCLAAN